jgi:hypothetical protein
VEDDGELHEEEIIFEKMEDAIYFCDHFKVSIEPIVLEYEGADH